MNDIQDRIELWVAQPHVRCDFSRSRCFGRLQLPIGSQLYLDKEHANSLSPVMVVDSNSYIYHIDFAFSALSAEALVENQDYYDKAVSCVSGLIDNNLVMSGHEIGKRGFVMAMLEMNFSNVSGGMKINFKDMGRNRAEEILFATNPGIILQISETNRQLVEQILHDNEIFFARIGYPCDSRRLAVRKGNFVEDFDIDYLRKIWYPDFKDEPLMFSLGYSFLGKLEQVKPTIHAAVQDNDKTLKEILAQTGFVVVESDNLDDVSLLIYNDETSQIADFLSRGNTLAIGVGKNDDTRQMRFVGINIEETNNIMLSSLAYRKLGIWTNDDKVEIISNYEGRQLRMNALLGESIYPNQWGWYPEGKNHDVSPWVELFLNAHKWLTNK